MDEPVKREAILAVDDDWSALERYRTVFRHYDLRSYILCADAREVDSALRDHDVAIVLLDLNMPHVDGRVLLQRIVEYYPNIPVIVLTAETDTQTAVECMKSGAFDYMIKPIDTNRLVNAIHHGLRIRELERTVQIYQTGEVAAALDTPEVFRPIVTQSAEMHRVFRHVEAIARSPEAVLITGESGTGKELVVRAIHTLSGRTGELVSVNVSGLDDTMFSDSLFGHVKGAYTGAGGPRSGLVERAADGTLFLDEIGDLDLPSQVKLLRLLQEREYYPLGSDRPLRSTARVVAATNTDLTAAREAGTFRNDLYYRLVTHRVELPPLRDRHGDLPILLHHLVRRSAASLGRTVPAVPAAMIDLLAGYEFPGNVRELQSLVYDAMTRTDGDVLEIEPFRDYLSATREWRAAGNAAPSAVEPADQGPAPDPAEIGGPGGVGFPPVFFDEERFPTLREVEEYLIERALKVSAGNQSKAAGLLGIAQSTISRRLRERESSGPDR